jgi:hypothetical protein
MRLERANDILKKLALSYNKDPKNWGYTIGRGHDDRSYDILVSHKDETWQIKLDTLFGSNPIGFGSKIEKVEKSIPKSPFTFGFRPLGLDVIEDFLDHESQSAFEEIMKIEPTSTNNIDTPFMVQGPIHYSGPPPLLKPINYLSKAHESLDFRLKKEIDKQLSKSGAHSSYI